MSASVTIGWDYIDVGETLLDSLRRFVLRLRVGVHCTNLNENEKIQI